MNYPEKLQRCLEYVEALEEERRKIQVFQRELPLCLELVTQAIEACRRELLSGTTTVEYLHGQSECSEQTSSEGPVLAEFIPIKKTTNSCSDDDDDDEDHDDDDDDDDDDNGGGQQLQKRSKTSNESNIVKDKNNNDLKKKSDWLRSVQLWNQSPDPPPNENVPKKAVVTEVKRNGGAFQPFRREKSVGKSNNNQIIAKVQPLVPASATSSTVETAVGGPGHGGTSRKEEKEGQQIQRKQRRCWSPELHRRFLNALQQLGGSHAATPKQIRELMKVDGLTNDEVKSHLQKYRLHTRRPSPTIHNNSKAQASQFVVVGGLWMPPPEYAAVAATASTAAETATIAATAGIYAPVATQPLTAPQVTMSSVKKLQPAGSENRQSERRGSHSDGGSHSNSPSTSSSTHTTTNSPVL